LRYAGAQKVRNKTSSKLCSQVSVSFKQTSARGGRRRESTSERQEIRTPGFIGIKPTCDVHRDTEWFGLKGSL